MIQNNLNLFQQNKMVIVEFNLHSINLFINTIKFMLDLHFMNLNKGCY